MATTIDAQNALQIREKPMEIYVTLQTGSSAKISSYSPQGSYKTYDSTLGDSSISMREIADLADGGFPLDGSRRLYDPAETPDSTNGKLGLRGTAGQSLTLGISASATLTAITVATRGAGTISVAGGTTYTATGLNVIPINASSATLTITPAEANGRAEVEYIVPGIILTATNDTLIRCALSLRGNLSVIDHTWEESEIEIQMYYPYDISSSFSYVQNDWPITYRAGYDGDLSPERKFYLSDEITMKDNLITIKGVDASHWLDQKTMQEQWLDSYAGKAHQTVYSKFISAIESAGITLKNKQGWSGGSATGTRRYAVLPEMTARDFIAGTMNLTLNHTRSGTSYAMQFVDAGIPSVEYGDGTTYGRIWTIRKSDCGDWTETRERAIAKIQDTSDERKFNETLTFSISNTTLFSNTGKALVMMGGYAYTARRENYTATTKDQIMDLSFDGYYLTGSPTGITTITSVPSRFLGKVKATSSIRDTGITGSTYIDALRYEITNPVNISGKAALFSGGITSFSNPDGLPGQTIEMEPFTHGALLDANGETVFNYPSLFKRSTHTIGLTWKGDPRMQPLDYIRLVDDTTGTATAASWYRITNIDLVHEGGGTQASIEAREWERPLSVPDYFVLADNVGDHIITNDSKEIEILTEGE